MPTPLSPLPFVEALNYAISRKVVLPGEYYGTQPASQRAQSFSVAGLAQIEQIKAVKASLDEHLKTGGSFADWVAKVKGGKIQLDLSPARLDNIFRTNVQAAYNNGRYTQQTNPDTLALRPYWMYDAINDSRTRPAHHAMDNVVRRHDDIWWDTHYPPNGYRCRCTVISLTEKQAAKRGITVDLPPNAEPDPGFDYSPGDYATPVVKAISDALTKAEVTTTNASAQIAAAGQKIDHAGELSKIVAKHGEAVGSELHGFSKSNDKHFQEKVDRLPKDSTLGKMPQAALRALYSYSTSDYRKINDVMRNPEKFKKDGVLVDVVRVIRDVFRALEATPVKAPKLYRALTPERLPPGFDSAHQVGQVVQYNGVTSTTKDPSVFGAGKSDAPYKIELTGEFRHGIDIEWISASSGDKEVIFKPGTKFVITERTVVRGKVTLKMQVAADDAKVDAEFSEEGGEVINLTPESTPFQDKMDDGAQVGEPNAAAKWAAILGEDTAG